MKLNRGAKARHALAKRAIGNAVLPPGESLL
jgi:hypothetical protein